MPSITLRLCTHLQNVQAALQTAISNISATTSTSKKSQVRLCAGRQTGGHHQQQTQDSLLGPNSRQPARAEWPSFFSPETQDLFRDDTAKLSSFCTSSANPHLPHLSHQLRTANQDAIAPRLHQQQPLSTTSDKLLHPRWVNTVCKSQTTVTSYELSPPLNSSFHCIHTMSSFFN